VDVKKRVPVATYICVTLCISCNTRTHLLMLGHTAPTHPLKLTNKDKREGEREREREREDLSLDI